MGLQNPLINGFFPSYADIEVNVNGLHFVGVSEVNYSDDLKRSKVKGTQKIPLGLTNGSYEAEGDIEFTQPAAALLISTLSALGFALGGFRFVPCGITIAYVPVGVTTLIVDDFVCFLGKQEQKNKVSDEAIMRRFTLVIPGAINWNGSPGAIDLNSIGAVA
jgi:hypothetical protein